MNILRLFALFVLNLCCVNSDEITNYVTLIQREIQRINQFTLPKDSKDSKPCSEEHIEFGTFDHIIIGAGSAGAIIASRLSEDDFRNVLLLEAGGKESNFTEIGGMAPYLVQTEYNWNYQSIPQNTSCLGMHGKRCRFPRGKMLGGSSGINSLMHVRGSKADYNKWCGEGNSGWCFNDLLPFFKKMENAQINGDSNYHGHDGFINVEYAEPLNENNWAFINANRELGRSLVDYNGKRHLGVGLTHFNTKNGRRQCTSRTYLKATSTRKNLTILTHSHVTLILIDPDSKKAYGVIFAKNNRYYVAKSRKDIILSAGTIGSAQLLMLSGIGPQQHLQNLGIPVLQNLDVGKNLQDHVMYPALRFNTNIAIPAKNLRENVIDYLNGVGDLVDAYHVRVVTFIQTNSTRTDDSSDIEQLQIQSPSNYELYETFFNYDAVSYDHAFGNVDYTRSFGVFVILLHPKSKGRIKLKSADPFEYPLIDSRFFSDSLDVETMYQGIRSGLQLLKTDTFKKVNARLYKIHLPACQHLKYLSKAYWYCQIRHLSGSIAHLVGTCKMGPYPSQGAVVDSKLRVHGIKNLRVADASIMPTHVSAHTNAPTMMIGERAAHMIRFE